MLRALILLTLLVGETSGAATLELGECAVGKFSPALPHIHPQAAGAEQPTLVIIIDDIGYQLDNGEAAIQLPGKLNYAVLPYTPHGTRLAELAHRQGKEILLHAPMSNIAGKALGPGALTHSLDKAQFDATLAASLDQIPHVRGVNNHMGSALTQQRTQMQWLMEELAKRKLYFIDSRTDRRTVAATVATEQQVPNLSRQVFLDNRRDRESIAERFHHFTQLAQKEGLAVAIGHPYPETIEFLHNTLPELEARGFQLAFASEALQRDLF